MPVLCHAHNGMPEHTTGTGCIMAALFMDLLVALTCGCLILLKIMLFVCAWVLTELLPHPVYAWKQMSYFRRKKLSLQYCLKLSSNSNYNNPAYATVFNSKFHSVFERKPTQLPPLAVGVKKSDVITSAIPSTPPWLLTRPAVNFTLHCSDKSNTPPEIFKHRLYELCHEFRNYYRIFIDGSKEGNRVELLPLWSIETTFDYLMQQASSDLNYMPYCLR